MGIRAATAALQGLATGNANQAAVGAISPYLNKAIKEQTTYADGTVNTEANLIAHAILGAIEAKATGNNALAGATGAATAEFAAQYIAEKVYGVGKDGKKVGDLTEAQKGTVTALSQVVAGLSGTLVGDSTVSTIASSEIGKRAVENNFNLNQIYNNSEYVSNLLRKEESDKKIKELEQYGRDVTVPHYVSLEGGIYIVSGKLAINTRTGDTFYGFGLASPFSTEYISKFGLSANLSWITNLKSNEIGSNLGNTINQTIGGLSSGIQGCYYACFGISETFPSSPRRIYSLGLGTLGSSAEVDTMRKFNEK